MSKNETHKTSIDCDCGTYMLKVQSEVEYFGTRNEMYQQNFYLAMFSYGSSATGWKYRLKAAWHVITKGEPYADQMALNPDEAKKLADFINEYLK